MENITERCTGAGEAQPCHCASSCFRKDPKTLVTQPARGRTCASLVLPRSTCHHDWGRILGLALKEGRMWRKEAFIHTFTRISVHNLLFS